MKSSVTLRLVAVLLFIFWASTGKIQAQVPAPVQSNISACIQIQLPSSNGTILVVPDLINMQSHVSWAYLLPGNSNINNLTWHEVSFNLADSTYPAIVGLANKPGANQFYIVYQDGTVALSTASVTGISAPVVLGQDTNYSQFTYTKLAGQNALYLLTSNGNIDISRNGGQSWQIDTGGAPFNYFIDLAVDTFGNAYAFYTPGGTVEIYKQDANSNTWLPVTFPNGQLPTNLSIDRYNRFFVSTYNNGVYYSLDTGNTWTRSVTTINGVQCGHVADDALGNLYMTTSGGAQLYRSIDGGADWTEIDAPITLQEVDSNYLDVINSISGDSVLTASTIYGVFTSTDLGNTWSAANTGLHETQFNGFYKSTSGRFVEASNNGLFYEDPQATTFTHVLPAAGYGYAGPILADTIGNIYTTTETGYISGTSSFRLKSSDNGTSWQPDTAGISAITSPGCFGVDEYGNEHLSGRGLFGVGLLYKKTEGATAFVLDTAGLYDMTDPFYAINALASDDNGTLFLGGGGDANLLTCWSRPINGTQWALDTAGLGGFPPISFLTHESNHNMIAIASGLYYHQAGRWNVIPFPSAPNNGSLQINAVAADNSGGIIASFTYSSQFFSYSVGYGIYCTHDHGTTWSQVGLNGVTVYGLYNFGDTTYALSDLGIFALTCNGIAGNPLSIVEPENNSAKGNMVLYPNPTSGLCHAAFTLAASASKSELTICDISGRAVKTISIAPDANEVSFNTNDMNSGIYFCVLKSDDSVVEVKKLVVVR